MTVRSPITTGLVVFVACLLAACGEREAIVASSATPSSGQAAPPSAAPKVSFYAASRFAEQATFGPTPALIAELQSKGFEKWIDDQFALPPSLFDPAQVAEAAPGTVPEKNAYVRVAFGTYAMSAPDQLRLRTTWSLSQFLVARGTNTGAVAWANLLQQHAFADYGKLLRAVSTDPTMGAYLNNVENRPKSANCPTCAPNENYARELMQLFSLGVLDLGDDGMPLLDAQGQARETYTQADVENLARALTGWQYAFLPGVTGEWHELKYLRQLQPSPIASERDAGSKRVLGRTFPAGQSHDKELDDVVALLMGHRNIAPFVSLRLIQNLVTSQPDPAYIRRVVAVFRNNGAGVAGDMKAVLKAVLLDPEARRGDVPGAVSSVGKYREPFLWYWAFFRALGCQRSMLLPRADGLDPYWMLSQNPFGHSSVFGYYQGTDRSPGKNLLAPEQKLITADEMRQRMYQLNNFLYEPGSNKVAAFSMLDRSGCDVASLTQAYTRSPQAFSDWVSQRFFRGAMPPGLRRVIEEKMVQPYLPAEPAAAAMLVLSFALSSPYFAVML